jgi:hypothetical protein
MAVGTVKVHLAGIYRVLGAHSRVEAIARAGGAHVQTVHSYRVAGRWWVNLAPEAMRARARCAWAADPSHGNALAYPTMCRPLPVLAAVAHPAAYRAFVPAQRLRQPALRPTQ